MTIKSQNQLLRPEDRLALRMESEFKTRNQKQFPDPFDAHVFIDHITEEVVRSSRSDVASSTTTSLANTKATAIAKCRVFDQNFYHAGQTNPLNAKSRAEYQSAINQCQEGYIRIDHADIQNLTNGSIWSCTMKDQTIQLLSLVQASAFSFNESAGRVLGGPSDAFRKGIKGLLGTNPRIPGSMVQIAYSSNGLKDQAKKIPYNDFLPILAKKLTDLNYSQATVGITSMFRGPVAQVNAMMGGRITQGSKESYNGFVAWLNSNYKGRLGNEVRDIVAEKEWHTDVKGLKERLVAKVTEQYNRRDYLSTHMESGAIDLKTKNLRWPDIEIMLESLKQLKKEGHVKMYQIENKRSNLNEPPSGPEHIHLTLTTKGGPGE